MRLIDVNDTISELKTLPEQDRLEYMGVYDLLKSMPAIDAEPVVHGHWIQKGFDCVCSNCGSFNGAFGIKYCSDCGAKMDEEK